MYEILLILIKSGGGNGPMKPGNLRQQGAKSGEGNRQMRGRMLPHCFRQRVFLLLKNAIRI